MKRIIVALALLLAFAGTVFAQEAKPETGKQFMQILTVESVIGGGMGRSKMVITNPDGSQKESDMENLFSIAGINFKNIRENEDKLLKTIKSYTDEGWKIEYVTPFTLSPGNNGQGIFMTRYLLSKPDSKKGF